LNLLTEQKKTSAIVQATIRGQLVDPNEKIICTGTEELQGNLNALNVAAAGGPQRRKPAWIMLST